jgi:CheY-like chemotaxis protein
VRDLLTTSYYEVIEVENGEEALAAVARQPLDLILMDIQLPILDGYEPARRTTTPRPTPSARRADGGQFTLNKTSAMLPT